MRRTWIFGGAVAPLVAIGAASADFVYFANGGQAQLKARVAGEAVELETPEGPRSFRLADFAAIVPGGLPDEEWARRAEEARRSGTVEARFAAAWWALENGLTDDALAALRDLGPAAPPGTAAARAVGAVDRLALPCPDPDLEPLRARLRPGRFREVRGPHAVLLHQGGEADALTRLDVIERVVKTFHVAFAAQGIELPPPGRRVASVYFAEHRDYVDFLRRSDAGAFAETQGYYHPVLQAVFAFDARSGDEQRSGRRAIANRKIAGDPPSELARRAVLLDLAWRATDLGIVAHETVHQLTASGGLAPAPDAFPTWLHEGLAAQFEVIRGGRWAGFGRANDLRLPDWRGIRPAPRLAPLLRDSGFGHGYRRDLYAESWALVYFLKKAHPREFVAFLDLLRVPQAGRSADPDRASRAFRAAFGNDLATLESAWHVFLADVKTPLESGRPAPRP